MPLSSVLGAQSLVRPGVCTSSTRPASPFEGQVIYETDTNQTLVYSGSAWVMIADIDTPPGLQLIKAQTVGSAVTSIEVTGVFSSEYQNYKIIYTGGSCSAQGAINFKLGSSTTTYYSAAAYAIYGNGAFGSVYNNNTLGYWYYAGSGESNVGANLNIDVHNPFDSTRYTTFGGPFMVTDVAGSVGGVHKTNASYTDFTLLIASGTVTGGVVRVYGYRNS